MSSAYFGHTSSQSLTFRDFPLERKTKLWNRFPSYLEITSQAPPLPKLYIYPEIESITYTPTYPEWEERLALFKKSTGLEKVVLSRIKTITFRKRLDPYALYAHIIASCRSLSPFAYIVDAATAFLGATPERLYRKEGNILYTEALAGTRPLAQKEELFASKKEWHEFQVVKKDLYERLQKIAHPFPLEEIVYTKEAGHLIHFYYPFQVELQENIPLAELTAYLHPTSAIGGFPREEALAFIEKYETHDRGYYAGTVGYTSKNLSETHVMIRSALLEENRLHIFTGIGATHDSDPRQEWNELEEKTGLFGLPIIKS